MLDLERVAQEFAFLRDKLKETSEYVATNNAAAAGFLLGSLYSICNNHAVSIAQMIPPKQEVPIDEPVV